MHALRFAVAVAVATTGTAACTRAEERPPAPGEDAGGARLDAGLGASSGAAASGSGGPAGGGPSPGGAGSPGASSGGSSSTGGAAVLVVPEPPHALDPLHDHPRRDGGAADGPAYRTEPSALCVPAEWTTGATAGDAKPACRAGLDARVWADDVPRGCASCRFSFAEAITRRERRAAAHRDVCCFVTSEAPAPRGDAGR